MRHDRGAWQLVGSCFCLTITKQEANKTHAGGVRQALAFHEGKIKPLKNTMVHTNQGAQQVRCVPPHKTVHDHRNVDAKFLTQSGKNEW